MTDQTMPRISRRLLLKGGALIGCSAAAMPFMTSITLAAAPTDKRLVVIILRGAMDGIDVVRPVGDPDYARYRHDSLTGPAASPSLGGFFALHPALADLMPMWRAGELAFAHAVATPYRNKRSHFDGQDILEAGTGLDVPNPHVRTGWLNRMLQVVPGMRAQTAFAVGRDEMKVIEGSAPYMSWAPDTRLTLSDQSRSLLDLVYHDDPLFSKASAEALDLSRKLGDTTGNMMGRGAAHADQPAQLARFTAARLREETRIAAFSISGWDTHHNQRAVLQRQLLGLSAALVELKAGLGPDWGRTAVLAMTEFGRTARENGTGGTDHGTGGAMLMAGGAIRGGRVYGHWPGLADGALYQDRDLMPTADVRAYAAWAMRGLFGFDRHLLETTVFPRLDMGVDPHIIA